MLSKQVQLVSFGLCKAWLHAVSGVDSVILPDTTVKDPAALVQALIRHRVTHLTLVPTLLQALLPHLEGTAGPASCQAAAGTSLPALSRTNLHGAESLHKQKDSSRMHEQDAVAATTASPGRDNNQLALRVLISSGEPLPNALAGRLRLCLPASCCLLNLYGSTELAADCTCFRVPTPQSCNSTAEVQPLYDPGPGRQPIEAAVQDCGGVHDVSASATLTAAPSVPQQHQQTVSGSGSGSAPPASGRTAPVQSGNDHTSLQAVASAGMLG